MEVKLEAFGIQEKVVTPSGNTAHVYLPREWIDKKVVVLLVEQIDKEE